MKNFNLKIRKTKLILIYKYKNQKVIIIMGRILTNFKDVYIQMNLKYNILMKIASKIINKINKQLM
jgi:hypothetical protein